jgi:hypothetical protein
MPKTIINCDKCNKSMSKINEEINIIKVNDQDYIIRCLKCSGHEGYYRYLLYVRRGMKKYNNLKAK